MSEVIDALTLILDNHDMRLYERIQEAARAAVVEDMGYPNLTLDGYRDVCKSRPWEVTDVVGAAVVRVLDEMLGDAAMPSLWELLLRDVLELQGGETRRALGDHYMPEPDDMEDVLASDEDDEESMSCGFCGGKVVRTDTGYEHADDGDRVKVSGPGDMVSARHNRAGTQVLPADVVFGDDPTDGVID